MYSREVLGPRLPGDAGRGPALAPRETLNFAFWKFGSKIPSLHVTAFKSVFLVQKMCVQNPAPKHTNEVRADKADKTHKRDWTQSHSTHYIHILGAYIHSADRSSYTPLPTPFTCLRHVKGVRYPHHPHMPPARSSRMPRRHSDATHPTSPPARSPYQPLPSVPLLGTTLTPLTPHRARHAGRTLFFHVL